MYCMGAPNDLKAFDFRAFINSHKLCIPAVFKNTLVGHWQDKEIFQLFDVI